MLSQSETKLLCEIGPGTPMGNLLRRFWLPALLSEELPTPDCTPVAFRVLAEDLVAFRDSRGKAGIIDAYCPHRHAHLYWGRNEEGGLRCTYHGWKYDTEGNCLEMPNEPPESIFKDKIRTLAYPTREAGGIVWAYMGPREKMPSEPPAYEWARVPDSHRITTKRLQMSNWAQAVEGGIDSSHISFLHSRVEKPRDVAPSTVSGTRDAGEAAERGMAQATGSEGTARGAAFDRSPRFWTSTRDFGFMVAARRNAADEQYYWRVTPFMLPSSTIIPGGDQPDRNLGGHVWVPMDDHHVWTFSMTWNTERPISDEERAGHLEGYGIHTEIDPHKSDWDLGLSNAYLPVRNRTNNYMIDREEQRTRTFTGIKGISEQDMSIQEAMGAISPRWLEHLGTTDKAIIEFRSVLLGLCRDLMNGKEPAVAHNPLAYQVRSAAFNLGKEVPWEEGAVPYMQARA